MENKFTWRDLWKKSLEEYRLKKYGKKITEFIFGVEDRCYDIKKGSSTLLSYLKHILIDEGLMNIPRPIKNKTKATLDEVLLLFENLKGKDMKARITYVQEGEVVGLGPPSTSINIIKSNILKYKIGKLDEIEGIHQIYTGLSSIKHYFNFEFELPKVEVPTNYRIELSYIEPQF